MSYFVLMSTFLYHTQIIFYNPDTKSIPFNRMYADSSKKLQKQPFLFPTHKKSPPVILPNNKRTFNFKSSRCPNRLCRGKNQPR